MFSLWPKGRGEKGLFWRLQEVGVHCEVAPKSTSVPKGMKSSPFEKF